MPAAIALDATYSVGEQLTGVGVYSTELLNQLTHTHPETRFRYCYRAHRLRASFSSALPNNASRALLGESGVLPPGRCDLFHGLNQRMPQRRFRRSVCTFHDLFVITGEYSSPEFRSRFTAQAQEAAARADLVIAVSAFTGSQVSSLLNVEPSRIRVVHHGIRPLACARQPRQPIVLNVGAIQHRKNILRLVKAFESLPADWRLVLAGSPNGFGAESVIAAIQRSPARSRIDVTGYIPLTHLAQLYQQASIFAFPSCDEGFGMPVLEAMAQGVPVVTSNRSALPEVVGDAALLVDPCSLDSIAEGLTAFASNESLRAEYAERGIRRAGCFSWVKAAQQTWAVYRELLS